MTAASLGKVNSETNLAVQLLLAVSDGGRDGRKNARMGVINNPKLGSAISSSSDANRESNDSQWECEVKSDWSDCPPPRVEFACDDGAPLHVTQCLPVPDVNHDASVTSTERMKWSRDTRGCENSGVSIKSSIVSISPTRTGTVNSTIGSASYAACNRGLSTPLFKYTRQERQEALQRFREKKQRRQFQKRVRYHVRKRLAEARPRYKGRFSKPSADESSDDGSTPRHSGSSITSPSGSGNMPSVPDGSSKPNPARGDTTRTNNVSRKAVAVSN